MPPIATATEVRETAPVSSTTDKLVLLPQKATSKWDQIPTVPLDPMFELNNKFLNDASPDKVNLGIGAYRGEDTKPWPLPSVQAALEIMLHGSADGESATEPGLVNEYLGIDGHVPFTKHAASLLFGGDERLPPGLVSLQTVGGSGANHLGATLLQRFYRGPTSARNEQDQPIVYLPEPGWPNHRKIFEACGAEVRSYDYHMDKARSDLDLEPMLRTLSDAPEGSIVVLHPCGHNPTGWDPTPSQWSNVVETMQKRRHFAFLDSAYQGFASGDLDRDAFAIRLFAERRVPMLVCQSFSKNMGLYGQRLGCLHVVVSGDDGQTGEVEAVRSQLRSIVREEISTPPRFPADLALIVLSRPELRKQWKADMATMSGRIQRLRHDLVHILVNELQTPGNWAQVEKQKGMFAYLPLRPDQCARLVNEGHIYLTPNGRASMPGLNEGNVRYLAEWIDKVVRQSAE